MRHKSEQILYTALELSMSPPQAAAIVASALVRSRSGVVPVEADRFATFVRGSVLPLAREALPAQQGEMLAARLERALAIVSRASSRMQTIESLPGELTTTSERDGREPTLRTHLGRRDDDDPGRR